MSRTIKYNRHTEPNRARPIKVGLGWPIIFIIASVFLVSFEFSAISIDSGWLALLDYASVLIIVM